MNAMLNNSEGSSRQPHHTMIHTLIKIPRNKINSKHRCISKIFPGSCLTGHFVGGKPVANRAWLTTPNGTEVSKVILTAGLQFPEK